LSKIKNLPPGNYLTLDKFLTPIIEKFSVKPEKDFARYLFGNFNDKKIYYYAINGEMCFTIKEFSKYLDMKYGSVWKAFQRKDLELDKHFLEIKRSSFSSIDKLSIGKKGDRKLIFLTFLGVWKLLPTFRGDVPQQLYDWFGETLYSMMKSNRLERGEFFLTNSSGKIVSQVLGDKQRSFVDEKGIQYASKGEMLIAKTLRQLRVKFQYNAPIYLTKRIIKILHTDQSLLDTLVEANWYNIPSYITADFLIRTKPRTVIEYWGMQNSSKYNAKRKIKELIYRELEIRLIDVEAHEDRNIPLLKKKLMKELKIK